MQLEFVYKNKDASGNPIKYEIAEGANISMSYNEDLSNGVLLVRESTQIDIEPYDEIILYGLDFVEKYYALIESYVCKETRNKYNDKQYTYEIRFMSQTKLLENKILPSLAITPKTNGGLTIKQYLERYNDLYGQKVRTSGGFANKFTFDVGGKFDDVCPELQFNNPTFRECLTQLMMVKNCIPIVQNNVIRYIDLSEKIEPMLNKDDPNIAYVETSQSSEDYVSSLKTNIKNVIQEDGYTTTSEFINFRNKNSSIVNTNSMTLYTQYPIYDLISLEVVCPWEMKTLPSDINYTFIRGFLNRLDDGNSLIYEKNKWLTLEIRHRVEPTDYRNYYKYQNTTVYYTRGQNTIENFGLTTSRSWIGMTETALYFMLYRLYNDSGGGSATYIEDFGNVWKRVSFKITYKTKANIVSNLSKNKKQTTEREVVDNQNNNYINAYSFGLLEYAKANRLGNKMKTYSGRFPRNYANLPSIGKYYEGNEIIYKVDYQIWKEAVDVTVYTCPNYVLRNYFTGVKSQLRSWRIVDGDEAFTREENLKWYLEFDYNEHSEKPNEISIAPQDFIKYCFGSINNTVINVPIIASQAVSNEYLMDTIKNVCGNSLIFSFQYTDNFEVSRYITNTNFEGGMLQQMYSYVDGNGNFTNINYKLIKSYVSLSGLPAPHEGLSHDEYNSVGNRIQSYAIQQPKNILQSYNQFLSISRNLYKDNKEIPSISTQFEFCSAEGILLGDEFIKGHKGNGIPKSQLRIRISDVEPISDTLPTGTDISIDNVNINAAANSSTAQMVVNNMPNDKYCYIYNTANSKVLLGFRGNTIWLNLLKQRNKEIYTRDGNNNLVITGTI